MKIWHYLKQVNKYGIIPILYRYYYKKKGQEFPYRIGLLLNIGNTITDKLAYRNKNVIKVRTYDGSNQVVHPDAEIMPNGKIVLVCTPYPYNTEVYENPCLYLLQCSISTDCILVNKLEEPIKNPIDKRHGDSNGEHMSDPAIIIYDDKIHFFYRDGEIIDGTITDLLYERIYSVNDFSLLDCSLIRRSSEICVSPTFVETGNEITNYAVSYCNNSSHLVYSTKNLRDVNAEWNEFIPIEIWGGIARLLYMAHFCFFQRWSQQAR